MNILEQLKRSEGFRQFPYKDTKGIETIGYGFNLRDVGISEDEAEAILEIRVGKVQATLSRALPFYALIANEARRAVIEDMCYNMGIRGLLGFTKTLSAIGLGNWDAAADEMLNSEWAQDVGARAKRLSDQLRSGVWVTE